MGSSKAKSAAAKVAAIIQSCLNILADPNKKTGGLFTIYKSITNGLALDDLDPNKKPAEIEKKESAPQ